MGTERVRTGMARLLILAVLLTVMAAPARANQITMNFSGTVDFSGVGGAASNTFSGSVTWDPATAPNATLPGFAEYAAVSASFTLNSTDISTQIVNPIIGITDSVGGDNFEVDVPFPVCCVLVGPGHVLLSFGGILFGPTSMFSSTALPGNLDFLGSVSSSLSGGFVLDAGTNQINKSLKGSFTGTAPATAPVPEPGSFTLTALGLAGAAARYRRRSSSFMTLH
jgi:hypothetical protein